VEEALKNKQKFTEIKKSKAIINQLRKDAKGVS